MEEQKEKVWSSRWWVASRGLSADLSWIVNLFFGNSAPVFLGRTGIDSQLLDKFNVNGKLHIMFCELAGVVEVGIVVVEGMVVIVCHILCVARPIIHT